MSRILAWSRLVLPKDGWSSSSRLALVGRCSAPQPQGTAFRSMSTTADTNDGRSQQPEPPSTVKVLYDGECKICMHEIRMLRRLAGQRPVHFVDISTPEFSADRFGGVTYEMAMKEMHVIGADGQVHIQANAVRVMYHACGMGWLVALTQVPGMHQVFDALYTRFAVYRLTSALDRCDSGISCSVKLKHLRDKLRPPPGTN